MTTPLVHAIVNIMTTRTKSMTEGKRDFASSVWCVRGHAYQAINPTPSEALV